MTLANDAAQNGSAAAASIIRRRSKKPPRDTTRAVTDAALRAWEEKRGLRAGRHGIRFGRRKASV